MFENGQWFHACFSFVSFFLWGYVLTTFGLSVVSFCFLFFPDGRHFKPAYGKDMVDTLVTAADQICAELERSEPDQLAAHQNRASALQGQIDLLKSHQASQERRINFALAREAEEHDVRINEK